MQKLFIPLAIVILCYVFYRFGDSVEIVSGVAIFLFGMFVLEDGFRMLSGGFLEKMMKKVTGSTAKSIVFGAVSTTVMQSSTLVSLFSISFVSAGIIGLAQGVGIIFGANVGTTTGAWIIAGIGLKIDIAKYALPLIVFGVIFLFQKSKAIKGAGYVLAGIGFIFLGIAYIKTGFDNYSAAIDLTKYAMTGFKGVLVFTFIGVLLTLVMQSSHATLVVAISALSVNQVTYENALAIAIGANLGSSITTALGALNSNADGKRLAIAHIIFNGITAAVSIVLIHQLMWLVNFIADVFNIQDDDMLKLATFHTIFNTLGIVLLLPFMQKLVYFLNTAIGRKKDGDIDKPIYLDNSKIDFADASLEAIRNETKHLYDNALRIIVHSIGFDRGGIRSFEPIDELLKHKDLLKDDIDIDSMYDSSIKGLSNAIMEFTTRSKTHMGAESQMKEVFRLQMASKNIVESIKNIRLIYNNIKKYSLSENKMLVSEYDKMRGTLAHLLRAIEELKISHNDENEQIIKKIIKYKTSFNYDDLDILNKIDFLIAQKAISVADGTSMINDLSFMRSIAMNLIDAISALYDIEI